MRVNLNFLQSQNTIINTARVNASLAKQNPESARAGRQQGRKDRVTLSPQGKMMNMIENLRKQKEAIIKQKNDLVEATLQNGGKIEDIKVQLKTYGKQMEDIDKQIADIYTQQAKQIAAQEDKKKSKKSDEHKTEEQLEAEHFSKLAGASMDLEHAEKVSAVRAHIQGEVRVKEAEIDTGELHVEVLESKQDNVWEMIETENKRINEKMSQAGDLAHRADEIALSQGKELKEARQELEESREERAEQKEPEQ